MADHGQALAGDQDWLIALLPIDEARSGGRTLTIGLLCGGLRPEGEPYRQQDDRGFSSAVAITYVIGPDRAALQTENWAPTPLGKTCYRLRAGLRRGEAVNRPVSLLSRCLVSGSSPRLRR